MPNLTEDELNQVLENNPDLKIASTQGIGQGKRVKGRGSHPGGSSGHPVLSQTQDGSGLSETKFQQTIIDYARLRGWLVYHTHNSRYSERGFPDLFCVRKTRAIALEVKASGKKLNKGKWNKKGTRWLPGQDEWLMALSQVPGITARMVEPGDWEWIQEALK